MLSFLHSPTLTSIHDYWKTIVLTRWTFAGKAMSLLFNMLSRLVIAFLPRSKHLFTSWLQSPSAVILEPPKIKSVTVSTVSPSICHEVMGLDAMILVFLGNISRVVEILRESKKEIIISQNIINLINILNITNSRNVT